MLYNNADTEVTRWYAVRAKRKKEYSSAALLAKAGIEVYIPELCVQKQRGQSPLVEVLFPGYFFSKLDITGPDLRLIRYTPGVSYVLGYDNHPCPLPESLIQTIRTQLVSGHGTTPIEFRQGDTVVITSGPLRDMEAVYDRKLSGTGRVRVLIKVLNRLWRADAHIGQLQKRQKQRVCSVPNC